MENGLYDIGESVEINGKTLHKLFRFQDNEVTEYVYVEDLKDVKENFITK